MSPVPVPPHEEQRIEWSDYSIQYQRGPSGAGWWSSWIGERHRSDDPVEAERHLTLAHKALDRAYGGAESLGKPRLVKRTQVTTNTATVVPAMWDES